MNADYEAPVPGVSGAMCSECKAIKPTTEFKRWLSTAQARARGYSGTRRVQVDSALCKTCQPKRKAEDELTIKQLQARIFRGELHPLIGKDKIEKRRNAISMVRAKAVRKRWNDARSELWRPIRQALEDEVRRCVQQRKYIRGDENKALLHQFLDDYLETLRAVRAKIDNLERTLEQNPEHGDWPSFAGDERIAYTMQAWEAVPLEQRMAVRKHPTLVIWREVFAKPAPPRPARSTRETAAELPSERRARERDYAWPEDAPPEHKEHSSASAPPPSGDSLDWIDTF